MLVLTRRNGQSIRIGDDIVLTVLEATRDQVRIGIRAPRSVGVHREEVYQEILLENQAAADVDDVDDDQSSRPASQRLVIDVPGRRVTVAITDASPTG